MVNIPLLGRLSLQEYIALTLTFTFLALETLLHSITVLLPTPIIRWFYNRSRVVFHRFSTSRGGFGMAYLGASPSGTPVVKGRGISENGTAGSDANINGYASVENAKAGKGKDKQKKRERDRDISTAIRNAKDFGELCSLWGYNYQEHVVRTKDGYLLGIHRLPEGKNERPTSQRTNSAKGTQNSRALARKPVVYLHHGLLMNSEVWVCLTKAERCLPFVLVEQGFDVWLGNNRGNKYSKKSLHHSPSSVKFWDYSLDDFAWYDIPDSIAYILDTTGAPSLSYIGFSQGTAQAFAALSIHPKLNEKVDVFIALAPAMSPAGLAAPVVDGLMKASPTLMYLLFGRKAILSSAATWQSLLYPPIFAAVIDASLRFLFNWHNANITQSQKIAAYAHLYSFASVKSVVHWFQIMRESAFQMFDDDIYIRDTLGLGFGQSRSYRPARFPTRNIRTPIVLLYGDTDSLVDIEIMQSELPNATTRVVRLAGYEHLDVIWGKDVHVDVIPEVVATLKEYCCDVSPKGDTSQGISSINNESVED
ncbi:triacylglycerol lipase [Hygrophoropsis aurantiaca]|uniref:Triacylglycerol lipase n=1 Tax=Hygrophoropsis aurantiaca TaxID=72124 RepID=A0ACB8AP69_9AGAM|nr:triacylglycerol lipase [Hygrophoropsis aurantiaca]